MNKEEKKKERRREKKNRKRKLNEARTLFQIFVEMPCC